MKYALITIASLCLFSSVVICAEKPDIPVEQASIDWSRGVMISHGQARIAGDGNRDAQVERATQQAKQAAQEQLLPLVGGPVAGSDKATQAALIQFIDNNCVAKTSVDQRTSTVKVTVEIPISRAGVIGSREGSGPAQAPVAAPKPSRTGPFTSVIVNTIGLKLHRSMSPKIRRADDSEVWGTVKADYNLVADSGIVAYARSIDDARKNPRAGGNPLILNATARAGGKFYCDAVIDDADAKLMLDENAKTKFLDGFKVIFVVDGEM